MSNNRDKSRGLGRGLSALLADVDLGYGDAQQTTPSSGTKMLPIELLEASLKQPRRIFNQEAMDELAASVREKGIIQPLIVRELNNGKYQIVAGERRWRAAQAAKLHEVPVIIRDYSDVEVQEIAIIENIQRQDLNVVDEAQAYQALMDTYGHTQEKLSQALGKSRSHIANLLRLLNLPAEILEFLREGSLSMGHARALIGAENAVEIAKKVIKEKLSVRQVEALVNARPKTPSSEKHIDRKDPDTRMLEDELSAATALKIKIDHEPSTGKGKFVISYDDLQELDYICKIITLNQ